MKKIITELCVYILEKLNASVLINFDIAEKDGKVCIGINNGGHVRNVYVSGSKDIIISGVGNTIGFVTIFGRFKPVDKEVV